MRYREINIRRKDDKFVMWNFHYVEYQRGANVIPRPSRNLKDIRIREQDVWLSGQSPIGLFRAHYLLLCRCWQMPDMFTASINMSYVIAHRDVSSLSQLTDVELNLA